MKKKLIRLAKIILPLLIIFFSFGIFIPSVQLESKIVLNKPVETSFRVFNDPFQFSEWIPGFKKINWLSGKYNEAGSKWKFTIEKMGIKSEMFNELTAYKPNELFAFRMENGALTYDAEVKFIKNGTSSEIISSSKLQGKNIFWRSLFAVAKFYFQMQDQEVYNKLKEVIEKTP